MPTQSMLSIIPEYDLATRYGASWQTKILDAANTTGLPYVDLYKENATNANFFSNLGSQDPILINILGHGNYNVIACQDGELLLQGGINSNLLTGRVIYALSCRAGRDLGRTSFNEGALSFLCYNEDFIFVISEGDHFDGGMTNCLEDETARGFFESHNSAPISFIQGLTTLESYYASQEMFSEWIQVWEEIDSQVAGFLVWDRDHQVLHGEDMPRPVVTLGLGFLLLAFLPFIIPPIFGKK